jgi:hypothetical protein
MLKRMSPFRRKPWDRGRLARMVLAGGILAGETPAIPDCG